MIVFYKQSKQLKKIKGQEKAQIISYHEIGLSSKEIKKIFGRKYTLAQIAAIKAHSTMGTYK